MNILLVFAGLIVAGGIVAVITYVVAMDAFPYIGRLVKDLVNSFDEMLERRFHPEQYAEYQATKPARRDSARAMH
jgi:hypothetical protein